MSAIQPEEARRQSPPAGLNLSLSSNNPFRNRAASPALSAGHISPRDQPQRPVSRNPFLDASPFPGPSSPDKMSFQADSAAKPVLTGNAAELFDELTLSDRSTPKSNTMRPPPPPPSKNAPNAPRTENVPPRGSGHGHRPSRSQEEAMRARRLAANGGSRSKPSQDLDIFADPSENSPRKNGEARRVRRNSDSSVVDKHQKPLSPEEEKARQERRRRDRERRHRERESKDGGKPRKPDRKLDIIDQLDATSIYGTGLFHHDGPFDACNPHRNRKGSQRAPMQAFPKDSLNNVIGGSGPLNKRPDHATFLGNNDDEAFREYNKSGAYGASEVERPGAFRQDSGVVNVTRVEPIHGDESLGLGTSTFLEGAPASKTAIQRRASEQNSPPEGLSRKKSLAQKIRGINNSRYGPSGRMTNPDAAIYTPEPQYTPNGTKLHESNPFFNEFSKGDDQKERITIVEPEKTGRARAPSSPRRGLGEGLQRRVTSDGSAGNNEPVPTAKPSAGSSFLSRVKSLKGGPRRPKADKAAMPQEG